MEMAAKPAVGTVVVALNVDSQTAVGSAGLRGAAEEAEMRNTEALAGHHSVRDSGGHHTAAEPIDLRTAEALAD